MEAPGGADCPFHVRVDRSRPAQTNLVRHAETATVLAGPAGVLSEHPMLDNNRTFRLGGLHGRVMGIAVVETDCCIHAVLISFGSPASAWMADMSPEVTTGLRVKAVGIDCT